MIGKNYPYRTGSRLLMIPVALVVGVIVGLLWEWEAALLIGSLLIWLVPEIFIIFFKSVRQQLQEEEKQKTLDKKLKTRWYHSLFQEHKNEEDDYYVPPMDS